MQRSEQINELATALAKAQGEMEGASKERENPHFRRVYDAFAFAVAAIAGVAFSKIPAWVDRCVVAVFDADQKDALLELLAARAMQAAGDDTPTEAIESIIQKITAARKGMTHTFA